ncbi:FAD:protein FMN transferase [Pseudoxanthomonas winnipegensis]|uniref:FAD:protein FMN transferase n=1 Tax=Pseudoxanthomonas winnipegensis TaxID=2480810 RepID=A0A4Q8L9I3_9GAMM|nr:FAD:protein FMN transferase [Pseudoxanthomonas winnipegensis]RZZ82265.1 FAD:protein FMN transferase [Pseudoxanthomonas winnipegensis]TAA25190.1 FAD:protein FMN transferase [Pseudoxanthomonas winnipegensis]TAA39448.1 FAD:protein FMN transferase [Pseudoxanthomonas winnipegensis]TBV74347.1 FAD:protein FMN transferase [Pseudoxanthomonas winnipegensis]
MVAVVATPLELARLGGQTMGTTWSARVVVAAGADLHRLHDALQAQLDRVVAQMSTWETGSDLSRFNRAAAGTWHTLPADFATVMEAALRIARASDGAFDPACGALVQAWGFGAGAGLPGRPADRALQQVRQRPGWRDLEWRAQGAQLLQPGGAQLDLSAIAKGYAVDLLLDTLHARGLRDALVEVGGELAGRGRKPDGTPWRVLVETGADEDGGLPPRVLALKACAVATSGDRWHRFEQDGTRYSHTLDPRRGRPVEQAAAAVSVLAATAMEADAWATALTVMGWEAGLAFARAHGLAARFVVRGAQGASEHTTPQFEAALAA